MALNTTAAQNAINRKLAAVFWDMDGTLIDSERIGTSPKFKSQRNTAASGAKSLHGNTRAAL